MRTKSPLPTITTATVDGVRISGEIVSWEVPPNTRITHAGLIAALATAGLDTSASRKMIPRNAFARACRHLQEKRIIRKVNEDKSVMRFQFTAESIDGDRLRYDCETVLTLDKVAAKVTSEVPGHDDLVDRAQTAIDAELETRTGNDITDVVQRLFTRQADLFPVRKAGGCYFVPVAYVLNLFVDQVDTFLKLLGAELRRYPIPAGTIQGDRSVAASVNDGLKAAIDDHVRTIEGFDPNDAKLKDGTLEAMVARINETRFKMEAYAGYLGDKKAEVEGALAEARALLRAKIAEMGRSVAVPNPTPAAGPVAPELSYDEAVERREAVEAAKLAVA